MKRVSIFLVIVAMIGAGSCTSLSHKAELITDVDTLSYFYGMSRAEGIIGYLSGQAGVDTAYMDAFYKGYKDGAKNFSPRDVAYYEGVRIAHLINNQWVKNVNYEVFMGDSGQTVNRYSMLTGFYHGVKNPDNNMIMQAQSFSHIKMEQIKNDYRKIKYAELIAAGEKLLADNKNKADVSTTESGLQYKIITQGVGDIPGDRAKVKVNYRGILADGTEFDSSFKNSEPSTFYLSSMIKGWSEAFSIMPAGSKWELYIPQELAYGPAGQLPKIPPYATLIYEIEFLEIEVMN